VKQAQKAVQSIVTRFETKAKDVANVLAGPRREGWFNAESLIALSKQSSLKLKMAYGEQGYRKICKGVSGKTTKGKRRRIPDLVLYNWKNEPLVIIEAKLVYRSDTAKKRDELIRELADQILEAKNCCPIATCVGIVYLISRTSDRPRKHVRQTTDRFCFEIKTKLEDLLKSMQYNWVREPSILPRLNPRATSFTNVGVSVWLGLGAVAL
jgi:hypothetical protein